MVFNSNGFQNWLTSKVTEYLSSQFKTKISIDHIRYYPFAGFAFEKVFWGDQKNDTLFYVNELRFNIGGFNNAKQTLTLNDVLVDGGYCKLITYKDSTFNIDVLFNILDPLDTIPDTISPPFSLYFNRLACKNTRFRLIDSTTIFEESGFDGFNEDFYDINFLAHQFWIVDDSLHFNVKRFSCKEQSGFEVTNLKGLASISSTGLLFDSVDIKTPHSHIGNSFHMLYNDWDDFNDYYSKVKLTANVENAKVSMKDISYFAPFLAGNNQVFNVTGSAKGTTDNFTVKDATILFGNSAFKGNASFSGLPIFEETFIDIKATDANTNLVDLERLLITDLPNELAQLGNMQFKGNYTGFYNDFVAYGKFNSAIGSGVTDLNMKLGTDQDPPSYSGKIALNNMDLGVLFGNPIVGKISLQTEINGEGFSLAELNTVIKSSIQYIEVKGYAYQNISISGNLKNKMFDGSLDMKDEHAELNFIGTVNLNKEIPLYQFKAHLGYADLKALKLDTSNLVVSSDMDINFAYKDLDHNDGTINIRNTLFIKNGVDHPIGDIQLHSISKGNQKQLKLSSDMATASIDGEYNFASMSNSVYDMLYQLLPAYISKIDAKTDSKQRFNLVASIEDIKPLSDVFFPWINIVQADVSVDLNTEQHLAKAKVTVKELRINNYLLNEGKFTYTQTNGSATSENSLVSITAKDTALFKAVSYQASINNNEVNSIFSIDDTTGIGYANIESVLSFQQNLIALQFQNSTIAFKRKQFAITQNAIIDFNRQDERVRIHNLELVDINESILLNGFYDMQDGMNIKAQLQNINLSIIQLFKSDLGFTVGGSANGSIVLKKNTENLFINTYLTLDEVVLDKDTIGDFSITSNYDETQKRFISYVKSTSGKLKDLEMSGYVDMNRKPYPINFSVSFSESDLKSFQAFVKDNLTIYYGRVSAKCKVTGTANDIQLDGSINIMQVLARVEYLKCTYGFSSKITFNKNKIDVLPFDLTDINGKQAKAYGSITHKSLSQFNLDFKLTDLKGFQVLNTEQKDNSLFYGKAYATGKMSLSGPLNDLTLDATLKSGKGTEVSIPLSNAESNESGLIHFVNKDTLTKSVLTKRANQLLGFSMNLLITLTPDATVVLVFDEAKEDKIIGSGKGTLKMELTKQGAFNMFGEMAIESGEYKFTAIDVFTRKFLLSKGSTITWTGDPLAAVMNIKGVYRVRNTSYRDLVNAISTNTAGLQQRIPVECLLFLKGNLLSPSIAFDLNLPDASSYVDPETLRALDNSLKRLRSEPELMQQQVVSLLLFGSFVPSQDQTNIFLNSGLNNTVSDLLSAQATNLISKFLPGFNLSADFQQSFNNTTQPIITASKKFFNDRFEVQGSVNAIDPSTFNNIMGQYNLRSDGSLTIRGYNRTSPPRLSTNNQSIITQGVGLYYRKEFDSFNELLYRKNKERSIPK